MVISFKLPAKNNWFMVVSRLAEGPIWNDTELLSPWENLEDSGLYLIERLLHDWLSASWLNILGSKFQ